MLTPDGQAKLLDFGLAKLTDDLLDIPANFRAELDPQDSLDDLQAVARALKQAAQPGALGETADAEDESRDSEVSERADTMAGGAAENAAELRLTEAGCLIGTPAYRPPEMWLGAPATKLSDLYMLGEVLYEMCCGRVPHAYLRENQIRRASVNSDAAPLRQAAPTVNSRFAAVIDACISRSPLARPQSAAEVLALLEAIAADPSDEQTRRRHARRRLAGRLIPIAFAGASVLASGLFYRDAHQRANQSVPAAVQRPRIAVLGLQVDKNQSSVQTGFARTFSELLDSELAAGGKLLVLPAALIERVKLERKLESVDNYSVETLEQLNRSIGPDYIVLGTLHASPSNNRLLVDVTLWNAKTGSAAASSHAEGEPSDLFAMVSSVGRALRIKLGISSLSSGDRTGLQAERPTSLKVAELYAEGQKLLRRFDPVSARQVLTQAIELEPNYPLNHLALSDVLLALGSEAEAHKEIQHAFELAERLPPRERLLIEARYNEAPNQWSRAFALYRVLRTSFPDDPEYGLRLAAAQRRAGLPADALATLSELRSLPGRVAQDPRIDLEAAKSALDLSDFATALSLSGRATRQAETVGSPLIVAEALVLDAVARANLNDHQSAARSAERARDLFAQTGDLFGQSEALSVLGSAFLAQGDYARAEEIYENTLTVLINLGNSALTAVQLGNMADLLCQRGKLELAAARGQAGLLLAHEVNNSEAALQSLVILNQIALLEGQPTVAEQHLREAQKELPSPDNPRMSAWIWWHQAEILRARGKPDAATRLHELALLRREQYHLDGFAAESQAALATLALESARPGDAEIFARQALKRFQNANNAEGAAWAQALLCEALAAQHRTVDAQPALTEALARLGKSQSLLTRVSGLTALARAATQYKVPMGELGILRHQLREVIDLTRSAGMWVGQVELSVLLYRLDQSVGGESKQSDELCPLARRALDRGMLRVAELAAPLCSEPDR